MSKPFTISNGYFLLDIRDGSAVLATKHISLDALLEENRKYGIETMFCSDPTPKVRQMLLNGFVVATLSDHFPYCIVYTLDKVEQ